MGDIAVINLIYQFKNNDSILWVENNDIQLLVSENFKSPELRNTLIQLKPEIVRFLLDNKIFSQNDFLNKQIFKTTKKEAVLSFAQERLWFIEQYEEGTNAYHLPALYELDHATDKEGLKYGLQQIVSRHEILRTTIEQGKDQEHGIQNVHTEPVLIEEIQLQDTDAYESLIKEDINRPFNLSREYPIRIKFYEIQSASNSLIKTILLINIHHIASDGWSDSIFQQELMTYYEAYINIDKSAALPELAIQYKDYAQWQRSYLTGRILEKQLNYWKDQLSDYQTLEFPTDYTRPAEIDYKGRHHNFSLSKDVSQKLRALGQRNGTTLYSIMLSSFSILLNKYTGQSDIITGTPIANRNYRQTEDLIGFFVNTQVNRVVLNNTQNLEDLIRHVQKNQIEAQSHQDLPFEMLVNEIVEERDPSRHPIFQVMFGIQSFFGNEKSSSSKKEYIKPLQIEDVHGVEKFDLSVFIYDNQEELYGQISYATSLFHEDTIHRLAQHYIHILEQLMESPDKPYSELTLLTPEEHKQLIYEWNVTDKKYEKDKTICDFFEEQVKRTPDNIALVYEGEKLTYKELNEKSNQLAHYIRSQYECKTQQVLKPDTLIALCLERNLEMVIGILAVLKAGGAYVPIDPAYPQDRTDYLLEDTNAQLLLTQRNIKEQRHVKLPQDKIIFIDLSEDLYQKEDKSNHPKYNKATDLAYVIYTSGTTGKPKGVMIENAAVTNTVHDLYGIYGNPQIKKVTAYTSYVFDVSVSEIFTSLFLGLELHILANSIKADGTALSDYFIANRINLAYLPPVVLSLLPLHAHPDLISLIYAGEPCDKQTAKQWSDKVKLFNYYGPTEACIYATGKQILTDEVEQIGKPIQNTQAYILSAEKKTVPVGVIGELYLGGAGLARGYLNRPQLTAERFIENPFATESDKVKNYTRLYKTGDLVRWLPDGNIEYIRRNDDQVKIRGYRIELGEIENTLTQIEGIKQACVLAKEKKTPAGNNKYLVGYYVVENAVNIDQAFIHAKLSSVLPEYMIPAAFIALESLPLTVNGKLDKRALPALDFTSDENDIKPETELEIKLSAIYAEVLGLATNDISTQRNFFRMGGNSILSIKLKRRLNQLDEFKNITIADLFKYNSIQKLIQSINHAHSTDYQLRQTNVQNNTQEIAIISMSGAFSGANDIKELWHLIANQQEGIQFYNKEQCAEFGIAASLFEDPNYVPVSGHVNDIEQFDPLFWEISPSEAKQLDPQIRKFIEHSWFALNSAGYSHQRKQLNIGVFAGSGRSDYFYEHILNGEMADQINHWEAMVSNLKDALATRTSFSLGLSGPAISINTACSTGLVSVVEACKNLQLGSCDMALAGGVFLSMPDQIGYIYEESMVASRDGHCRTFDKDASGTIGSSGVGVVLLKRLENAIKDKDTILGVIKGYATNNDGDRKTGYTAPSVIGQSECIINAQRMAGISSNDIDYVECHGTATNIGDPIEIQALREAFAFNQDKEKPLKGKTIIGSLKANIGHSDSAAGTAGLMKICVMLQNSIIPGQVNFNIPNPELHIEQTNFEILQENRPWIKNDQKNRLAGVSSFGIGGTNAHVIVGDYIPAINDKQEEKIADKINDISYNVPLSAKSKRSLERYKLALLQTLTEEKQENELLTIKDLAYTLQERRDHFNFRASFNATDINELISKLKEDTIYAQLDSEEKNKIVFMFPGQGSQYTQIAKELYNNEEHFKRTIDQCILIANGYLDFNLYDVIYPDERVAIKHDINETKWTQVSLFIIEYALAKYLEHLGIEADAYIGHSFGEYVAATLAGVFNVEVAIMLLVNRGRFIQSMLPGSMLAINANKETILSVVEENNCEISLINSMDDVVVSGLEKDIKNIQGILEKQNIPVVQINVTVAGHSKFMDQAAQEFEKIFENIHLNKPKKYFASNLTGKIAQEEVCTAAYWRNQLRNTVQFAEGINTLSKLYNNQVSFIEVGAGKGLSYFVNKYKNAGNHKSIQIIQLLPTAKEIKNKDISNLKIKKEDFISRLWMYNIVEKPNDADLFKNAKLYTKLPAYQFDFQKCWLNKGTIRKSANQELVSVREKLMTPVWTTVCNLKAYRIDQSFKKNALVFIREGQQDTFDFKQLFQATYFVLLGPFDLFTQENMEPGLIRLNPEKEDHFKQLEIYLKVNTITIDTLIHCCSINNSIEIEEGLTNSFYSLFFIRQYLFDQLEVKKLIVLTNGLIQITSSDEINAFNGSLVGAIRNINVEFQNLDARIIDVGVEYGNMELAISQAAFKETYHKTNELLGVRFGKLWVEQLEQTSDQWSDEYIIEDNDTVLITGGLTDIALSLAIHISAKNKINFIFVSDQNLDQAVLKKMDEIRSNNSTVTFQCIDISNPSEIVTFLENVKKDHGTVRGVIHLEGMKQQKTGKQDLKYLSKKLGPKVFGIYNLLHKMDKFDLKFILCASSLSSMFGNSSIEHCAANSYLDYLSGDRTKLKSIKAITVNLPQWLEEETPREQKQEIELGILNEYTEIVYDLLNQSNYERVITLEKNAASFKTNDIENTDITNDAFKIEITEKDFSETEFQFARFFASILGIAQISKHDDFFKLGGNSIQAIKLAQQINAEFGCDIKVADVFRFKSIHNLTNGIQAGQISNLIKPYYLNYNIDLTDLIFIHPGAGGSEAYQGVAELLDDKFNCIGVDNYNIENVKKIGSLNKLAGLYLSTIEQKYSLTEPINLFGWSLGGRISLEIAAILELKGYTTINVILLDSQVPDETIRDISKTEDLEAYARAYGDYLLLNEIKKEHVEKVVAALKYDFELFYCQTNYRLKHTNVVLFRAIQEDTSVKNEYSELKYKHYMTLPSNNVNLLADKVSVIDIDCHHGNILESTHINIVKNYLLENVTNYLKENDLYLSEKNREVELFK
jgi:amino acid adenylation domain-containing protein